MNASRLLPVGLGLLLGIVGCGSPGDAANATFALDGQGVLRLDFAPYQHIAFQNPRQCERLQWRVDPDGVQHARCIKTNDVTEWVATPANGAPFACAAAGSRVLCRVDDMIVVDTAIAVGLLEQPTALEQQTVCDPVEFMPCDDDPPPPPGEWPDDVGVNPPDGVCDSNDPDDVDCETTDPCAEPGSCPASCDITAVRSRLLDFLQAELQKEGLAQYLDVSTLQIPFANGDDVAVAPNPQDFCDDFVAPCRQNAAPGACHCTEFAEGKHCDCFQIGGEARKKVCGTIDFTCANIDEQMANLWKVEHTVTMWLFNKRYDPEPGMHPAGLCSSTPLVLDLQGDGVEPTSLAAGVEFDIAGVGPLKTAWVRGDDALLVLDWNGDGAIDHAGELFGAVDPHQSSTRWRDGFASLARLDQPQLGGNGDGRIDKDDLLFAELRLWRDADGDGSSTPGELDLLAAHDIVAVDVAAVSRGTETDQHRNDLSIRGRFIRTDGSNGLVVDVQFVTASR